MLQVQTARRDILSEVPGFNRMPGCAQFVEQFRPHHVNLPVIRPARPNSSDIPVSNVAASMGVAFHTVIFDKGNLFPGLFAKRVASQRTLR